MTAARVLHTGVAGSRAELSGPPQWWSYSALKRVASCPRRYALERASYPELWDRPGYPPLPGGAALFGNVVHGALERIIRALTVAGAPGVHTAEAVAVLRELGGLTAVVETAAARELSGLEENPRVNDTARARISRELRAHTSEVRARVQSYLSRTVLTTGASARAFAADAAPAGGRHERVALGEGSHAEERLIADGLRVQGRIDLLTIRDGIVEIVDYKTGVPDPAHQDQLRLYALLWASDAAANPAHLPAATLTAAYPDADVHVPAPTAQEMSDAAEAVAAQVAAADQELRSEVPTAQPSEQNCPRCPVRHLCPEYWERAAALSPAEATWFDLEATVTVQNGPRSWWAHSARGGPDVLLRTEGTTAPFRTGDRLRFLGLRLETDPEMDAPAAKLTAFTEVFPLEEPFSSAVVL